MRIRSATSSSLPEVVIRAWLKNENSLRRIELGQNARENGKEKDFVGKFKTFLLKYTRTLPFIELLILFSSSAAFPVAYLPFACQPHVLQLDQQKSFLFREHSVLYHHVVMLYRSAPIKVVDYNMPTHYLKLKNGQKGELETITRLSW